MSERKTENRIDRKVRDRADAVAGARDGRAPRMRIADRSKEVGRWKLGEGTGGVRSYWLIVNG